MRLPPPSPWMKMISATAADPLAGVNRVVRPRSPFSLSERESAETCFEVESTRVGEDRFDRVKRLLKDRFWDCYKEFREVTS